MMQKKPKAPDVAPLPLTPARAHDTIRKVQRWSWRPHWTKRLRAKLPDFLRNVAALAFGAFIGWNMNKAIVGLAEVITRLLWGHP